MYGIETIKRLNEIATVTAGDRTAKTSSTKQICVDGERRETTTGAKLAFPTGIQYLTDVTSESWDEKVLGSPRPIVVDFYADWCRPCQFLAPIIDKLAEEFGGAAKFARIDVDGNPDIADRYGILSFPTIIIFGSGKKQAEIVGANSEDDLRRFITAHVLEGPADSRATALSASAASL
jgi:thioredoxin